MARSFVVLKLLAHIHACQNTVGLTDKTASAFQFVLFGEQSIGHVAPRSGQPVLCSHNRDKFKWRAARRRSGSGRAEGRRKTSPCHNRAFGGERVWSAPRRGGLGGGEDDLPAALDAACEEHCGYGCQRERRRAPLALSGSIRLDCVEGGCRFEW